MLPVMFTQQSRNYTYRQQIDRYGSSNGKSLLSWVVMQSLVISEHYNFFIKIMEFRLVLVYSTWLELNVHSNKKQMYVRENSPFFSWLDFLGLDRHQTRSCIYRSCSWRRADSGDTGCKCSTRVLSTPGYTDLQHYRSVNSGSRFVPAVLPAREEGNVFIVCPTSKGDA